MSTHVTLYSKNACGQCVATEKTFINKGIDYTKVYIDQDSDESRQALAVVKGLGYLQAPVIITESEHWSGFRPDKIATLVA